MGDQPGEAVGACSGLATAGGAWRTGGILGRAETLHPRQGILQATSQAGSAEEAER